MASVANDAASFAFCTAGAADGAGFVATATFGAGAVFVLAGVDGFEFFVAATAATVTGAGATEAGAAEAAAGAGNEAATGRFATNGRK